MSIDPFNDELINADSACDLMQRSTGQACNVTKLSRWNQAGCIGADGERHYLDLVRVGGRVFTTVDALRDFVWACSEPARTKATK
jgi:hypothetical protein